MPYFLDPFIAGFTRFRDPPYNSFFITLHYQAHLAHIRRKLVPPTALLLLFAFDFVLFFCFATFYI